MHAATLGRITAAMALGDRGALALNTRQRDHAVPAGSPAQVIQNSEIIGFFGSTG